MTSQSAFHRVLAAETVSNFGSMLSRLAIPWLAALALNATPAQMGWLIVADVAAGAIGSAWIGALVDRLPNKAVMVATDILRAALLALVAWSAANDSLRMELLVGASAASGLLTTAFELARSAWIAQSVAAPELPRRNAQLSAAASIAETLAFALGGWLYQALGAVIAVGVDAISYIVSACFLQGLAPPATTNDREPSAGWREFLNEARLGITVVWRTPALRTLAVIEVLLASGMSLAGTSYMIFVTRELGFAPGPLGMIFATGAIGALGGAAIAPWLGRRCGGGRALTLGLFALALATLWLPLASGSGIAAAAILVLNQVIGDGGQTVQQVHDRTLRQTLVEAQLLARVDGALRNVGQIATLIGALLGGAFASGYGTRSALTVAAALYIAAALAAQIRLGAAGVHQAIPSDP